jgi:hypothetical protein
MSVTEHREWSDTQLIHYKTEQTSQEYPANVNRAIEANKALALSGQFMIEHQNGNHTVWVNDNIRIIVSRCDEPTIYIGINF